MNRRWGCVGLAAAAAACADDPGEGDHHDDVETGADHAVDTADTADTAGVDPTGTSGTHPVCSGDVAVVEWHTVLVFEDFDFLADGSLITGANGFLMSYAGWDAPQGMLGFGLGDNPTGVRALPDGDVAVADALVGQVSLVDTTSGGIEVLASGLSNANGLAVGRDGTLFVSEHVDGGRVLRLDLDDGSAHVVYDGAAGDAPNGLALDEAGGLYVAFQHRIERLDLATGDRRVVYDGPASTELDAVTVDACGAVYTVGYAFGELIRVDPDGTATQLVSLGDYGTAFSSMRWGTGAHGLPRDHLYLGAQHAGVVEVAIGATGARPVF